MFNAYVSEVFKDINNTETIYVMLVHNKETLLNTLYTGNLSFCYGVLDSLNKVENEDEIREELLKSSTGSYPVLTKNVPPVRVEDTLVSFYTLMWDASRGNCLLQFDNYDKTFLVHDLVFKEDELSICINDNGVELFLLEYDKSTGMVKRKDFYLLIPSIKYLEFSNYKIVKKEEIEVNHCSYLKVKFPSLLSIYRNRDNFAINNKLIVDYYYDSKILSACGKVVDLLIRHLGPTTSYSNQTVKPLPRSSIFSLSKGLKIIDINKKLYFSDEDIKSIANNLIGHKEPLPEKCKEIVKILSKELLDISSSIVNNSPVFMSLELAKLNDKIRKQAFEKNMYLFNLKADFLFRRNEYKNITGYIERKGIKYILEDN